MCSMACVSLPVQATVFVLNSPQYLEYPKSHQSFKTGETEVSGSGSPQHNHNVESMV